MSRLFRSLVLLAGLGRALPGQAAPTVGEALPTPFWMEVGLGWNQCQEPGQTCGTPFIIARGATGILISPLIGIGAGFDGGGEVDIIESGLWYRVWSGFVDVFPAPSEPSIPRMRIGLAHSTSEASYPSGVGDGLTGRVGLTFHVAPQRGVGMNLSVDYFRGLAGAYRNKATGERRPYDFSALQFGASIRMGGRRT